MAKRHPFHHSKSTHEVSAQLAANLAKRPCVVQPNLEMEEVESMDRVRLVGGSSPLSGRLEMRYGSLWSSVCPGKTWGDNDGQVVCRELGLGHLVSSGQVGDSLAGSPLDPILMSDVSCSGQERALGECSYTFSATCLHTEVVKVKCAEPNSVEDEQSDHSAKPRPVEDGHGSESLNPATHRWTTEATSERSTESVFGGENTTKTTPLPQAKPQVTASPNVNAGIRLVGGSSPNTGRLLVRFGDLWSTVCPGKTWSTINGIIACRQLGFGRLQKTESVGDRLAGDALEPSLFTDVACEGDEQTLNNCSFSDSAKCQNTEVVMISCEASDVEVAEVLVSPPSTDRPTISVRQPTPRPSLRSAPTSRNADQPAASESIGVRLVGGSSPNSGRLLMRFGGLWSSICPGRTWRIVNGLIACRQLGFGRLIETGRVSDGLAGDPLDPIMFSDVECRGDEATLNDCAHSYSASCIHTEVVMVTCADGESTGNEQELFISTQPLPHGGQNKEEARPGIELNSRHSPTGGWRTWQEITSMGAVINNNKKTRRPQALLSPGPFLAPRAPTKKRPLPIKCLREPHTVSMKGMWLDQRQKIDVGRCRTVEIRHFNKSISERVRRAETCSRRQLCLPIVNDAVHTRTWNGPVDHLVIKQCGCLPNKGTSKKRNRLTCQRASNYQTFFKGTPFRQTIDVGVCVGRCGRRQTKTARCSPTQLDKRTLKGPNGEFIVEVIARCGCEESCYRIPYNISFFELNETKQQLEKGIIDAGQCVGFCSNQPRQLTSTGSDLHYRSPTRRTTSACQPSPRGLTKHVWKNAFGREQVIAIISSCECGRPR